MIVKKKKKIKWRNKHWIRVKLPCPNILNVIRANMYTHINWYTDLNKLIIKKFAKLKLTENIKKEKKPVIIDCLTLIYGVC